MTVRSKSILVLATALWGFTPGCALFSGAFPGGEEPGPQSEREAHLARIARARTERACIARVIDCAAWLVEDPERMGLVNRDALVEAIRRNEHLRDPARVETYFFSVDDVYPASCDPSAHAAIDRRIGHMQLVARACDQAGLVKALEQRRAFLRNTRARLDPYGVCLGMR